MTPRRRFPLLGHYVLVGREVAPEPDLMAWARWFETADRTVAKTHLGHDVLVSTVFIGLDHKWGEGPPHVFETLVFNDYDDGEMCRYSTWAEAQAGHDRVVNSIEARHGSRPENAPAACKGPDRSGETD